MVDAPRNGEPRIGKHCDPTKYPHAGLMSINQREQSVGETSEGLSDEVEQQLILAACGVRWIHCTAGG